MLEINGKDLILDNLSIRTAYVMGQSDQEHANIVVSFPY
jgi:hypothetical protein